MKFVVIHIFTNNLHEGANSGRHTFIQVGQLGDSLIPRHLRLAHIDTSGMAAASNAIYFTGTNEYLGSRNFDTGTSDGLRYRYEWGFWGEFLLSLAECLFLS